MTELLVALGLMVGVVGVSISLVQLMHWSEAKRAELLRRAMVQAFQDGYDMAKRQEGS